MGRARCPLNKAYRKERERERLMAKKAKVHKGTPAKAADQKPSKPRSAAAEERRAAKQAKKKAAKRAKREPAPDTRPPPPAAAPPKPLSKWMSKFLATPRNTDIAEDGGLIDVPLDDTYMVGFAARCKQEAPPKREDSSDDESVVLLPPPPPAAATFSVFVANVPFGVNLAQMRDVCATTGDLVDVDVPLCRSGPNQGRPAGYAIAAFASKEAADKAIQALDGRDFDGRELRARSLEDDNTGTPGRATPVSRRKAKAPRPRYFDDGDAKPARQSNVMRCCLCASDTHLMDACPNQLCRRCHQPGHQARACRGRPQPMPALCTACGAVGHSWKWCEAGDGEARLSDGATCMVCGKPDHLICGKFEGPTTHDVYCAWCARPGHTEPSCPMKQAGGRRSSPTGSSGGRRPSPTGGRGLYSPTGSRL